MAVNDTSDPEIARLIEICAEYARLYDYGAEPLTRARVEHLYKRDADFMAYDVAPPAAGYFGWNTYAKGWDHLVDKFSEFHFEFNDDVRVFRRGEVAWASASGASSGKSAAGVAFRKELRVTLIFTLEAGEWLITHEHVSAPRMFELPGGGQV